MQKRIFYFAFFISGFFTLANCDSSALPTDQTIEEQPFVVVICSYNNAPWVDLTLDSVFLQKYENFRVIYVDDASSDGTGELVEKYLKENQLEGKCTLIRNKERRRKLANLYDVLHSCNDNEIVLMLDGDDWFANTKVFSYINSVYADPNVWMTYGNYINIPEEEAIAWGYREQGYCAAVPGSVIDNNKYRDHKFVFMHLRTFRAWLFKQVKLEDLIANKIPGFVGDFYPCSNDLAMYYPMVELASRHVKFINKILYHRNLFNELVGFKVDRTLQIKSASEIRRRDRYKALEKPISATTHKRDPIDIIVFDENPMKDADKFLARCEHLHDSTIVFLYPEDQVVSKQREILKEEHERTLFIPFDPALNQTERTKLLIKILAYLNSERVLIVTDRNAVTKQGLKKLGAFNAFLSTTQAQALLFQHVSEPAIAFRSRLFAWKSELHKQIEKPAALLIDRISARVLLGRGKNYKNSAPFPYNFCIFDKGLYISYDDQQ